MTTTSETRIESARKRPGMYVGDTTDGSGATHLVFEVLGNAFDQYLAGRCSRVEIVVDADGTVMVTDDGPGLSVDGDETRPPLQQILTARRCRGAGRVRARGAGGAVVAATERT
jgi:DNA gyrase/topoisomerase IV subunit B